MRYPFRIWASVASQIETRTLKDVLCVKGVFGYPQLSHILS